MVAARANWVGNWARCAAAILMGMVVLGRADGAVPTPDKVVIVIEENKAYSQIIGNVAAPYINYLAVNGANFTQSLQVGIPSQPNYIGLFSGATFGISDDGVHDHSLFTIPNLGSKLLDAGLSFGGYSEGLPFVGYDGASAGDSTTGTYKRKHNPWVNWQDDTDPLPENKLPASVNMPFTDFPGDYSLLPTISIVVPNQKHDMHDGTIAEADAWLEANLGAYATWASTNNSLLIVTFDETSFAGLDFHIPTIFFGPMVAPGNYADEISHYNVLATLEEMYGLPHSNNSLTAPPIGNVWTEPVPEASPFVLACAGVAGILVARRLRSLRDRGQDSQRAAP